MRTRRGRAAARRVASEGGAELVVGAPPASVWRIVADVTRTGEWSCECRRVTWLGGVAAAAPGVRFRGSNRSGWVRWRRVCEITAVEPGRRLAWQTVSTVLYPDSTEWSITLEPAGGGTKIIQRYRVAYLPAWLDPVFARAVPAHTDRSAALEQDLRRLGALAAGGMP